MKIAGLIIQRSDPGDFRWTPIIEIVLNIPKDSNAKGPHATKLRGRYRYFS